MRYYDQLLAAGMTALFLALFYSFEYLDLIEEATRPISLIALYLAILTKLKQNP